MAVLVGRSCGARSMGLAVVDRAHRGAGKRHVVGDVGGGDGQLAGGLGHLVVLGDVLAVVLDHDVAGEGAVIGIGVGALGTVG